MLLTLVCSWLLLVFSCCSSLLCLVFSQYELTVIALILGLIFLNILLSFFFYFCLQCPIIGSDQQKINHCQHHSQDEIAIQSRHNRIILFHFLRRLFCGCAVWVFLLLFRLQNVYIIDVFADEDEREEGKDDYFGGKDPFNDGGGLLICIWQLHQIFFSFLFFWVGIIVMLGWIWLLLIVAFNGGHCINFTNKKIDRDSEQIKTEIVKSSTPG